MWQVSILLKNADKISPAVKAELANPVGAPAVVPGATPPASAAPAAPPAAAPARN